MMRHLGQRAFTLVEILMVVVILGIIAAVIVPQIGSRDDLKCAAAARVLISDLSYAQSRAISSQKRQYVEFEDQQYTLKSRTSPSDPIVAISHPINPGNYTTRVNTGPLAGVIIQESTFGTETSIAFDEMGSPMAYDPDSGTISTLSSPGTIRIQSGQQIMTITIEPYTGEMSVSQG